MGHRGNNVEDTAGLRPKRQSIAKNIGWLALANTVVKPFWFLFIMLTVRLLGSVGYGEFMLAISFVSVAAAVLEGGIDVLTVREISTGPQRYDTYLGNTMVFKLSSGIAGSIAIVAITFLFRMSWQMILLVSVACFFSMANTLLSHFRSFFRSFEVMKYEAISVILEKTSVIVLCGFILLVHRDVVSYMIGYSIAYCITCIVTFVILLNRIGRFRMQINLSYFWLNILKPGLPFALMNLFIIIYFRSGTIMLSVLTGRDDLIGYYNAGYRLVESFMLFPTIIVAPIYPVISRSKENVASVRSVLLYSARILLFISVSVSFVIFVFREQFTLLLFGAGYKAAATSVGILALTMIPISLNFGAGILVAALGRQGRSNVFIFVVTLINILANYILIKVWSVEGATLTTVITETLLVVCNIGIVHDYIPWNSILKLSGKTILPAVVAWLLVLTIIGKLSFPVQFVSSLTILLTGYFLLKVVTWEDLKRLASIR